MLSLLGVNIPDNKILVIGLTYIYGIGLTKSKLICKRLNLPLSTKPGDLNPKIYNRMAKLVTKYTIEMDLKKQIKQNIENLINLGTFRGLRHKLGLPVRGQRTRSNARTQRYLSNKLNIKKKIKTVFYKKNKKTIKKKIQNKKIKKKK